MRGSRAPAERASVTAKLRVKVSPVASNLASWSRNRDPVSRRRARFPRPQPWFEFGTLPPAPVPPARSVEAFASAARVSAGDGVAVPPPFRWRYHSRNSAAMPATTGVECDVPVERL